MDKPLFFWRSPSCLVFGWLDPFSLLPILAAAASTSPPPTAGVCPSRPITAVNCRFADITLYQPSVHAAGHLLVQLRMPPFPACPFPHAAHFHQCTLLPFCAALSQQTTLPPVPGQSQGRTRTLLAVFWLYCPIFAYCAQPVRQRISVPAPIFSISSASGQPLRSSRVSPKHTPLVAADCIVFPFLSLLILSFSFLSMLYF